MPFEHAPHHGLNPHLLSQNTDELDFSVVGITKMRDKGAKRGSE